MEAHVPETELVTTARQLLLPVGTEGHGGMAATNCMLPKMREKQSFGLHIALKINWGCAWFHYLCLIVEQTTIKSCPA